MSYPSEASGSDMHSYGHRHESGYVRRESVRDPRTASAGAEYEYEYMSDGQTVAGPIHDNYSPYAAAGSGMRSSLDGWNHPPAQYRQLGSPPSMHSSPLPQYLGYRRVTIGSHSHLADDEGCVGGTADRQMDFERLDSRQFGMYHDMEADLRMGAEARDEFEGEEKIDHRKRKRNRTIRSCVPCHNHKRKVSVMTWCCE
jgi:hypothetical protein